MRYKQHQGPSRGGGAIERKPWTSSSGYQGSVLILPPSSCVVRGSRFPSLGFCFFTLKVETTEEMKYVKCGAHRQE